MVDGGRVRVTPGQTHRVMVDGGGREVSGTLRLRRECAPLGMAKRSVATTAIRMAVDNAANVSLLARVEVMFTPVRVVPDEGVVWVLVRFGARRNYVNSLTCKPLGGITAVVIFILGRSVGGEFRRGWESASSSGS